MNINHGWATQLIIAAATLLYAANARADMAQEAAAEMRFQEAKALMEQGNCAAACPKLVESQRLDPAVGTLLYLGECYDRNGQTATAWATFLSAADAAHSAGQPDREKTARERALSLFAKVSKVTITVAANSRVAGLEVKLDGTALGENSWGVATALDPGEHLIEAKAPDRKPWFSKIRLDPGGVQATIAIPVLEPKAAATAALPSVSVPVQPFPPRNQAQSNWNGTGPVPPRAPEMDSGRSDGRTQRLIAIASGGVGVAGFAVGTIFGFVAKSKDNQSKSLPYCLPNNNTVCSHQGTVLIDDAKRDATIANVGFVVGGLGLATGAVLYLTAPRPSANKRTSQQASYVRIAPLVAPSTTGVSLAGAF